jgi:solute carrier family 15 (peptide/histidine transporter), member 3/4
MIPILNGVVYPFIKRKFNISLSENTRLIFGMAFSAFSVIIAGFIETKRSSIINDNPAENTIIQIIDNTTYYAANFHILWQLPQYTFVGLGEVFCSVSCLYYAYSAAPKSMQSIIMGLFYLFTGLGSFLGTFTLIGFKSFIYSSKDTDSINCPKCHLNYYFYFLSILQILGMIAFIFIDSKYLISKADKNEDNQEEQIIKQEEERPQSINPVDS